jgi:hypothetical protein
MMSGWRVVVLIKAKFTQNYDNFLLYYNKNTLPLRLYDKHIAHI